MRHKKVEKRITEPDKVHQDRVVTKFVNRLMKSGKKTTAEKQFYTALTLIDEKGQNGMEVFEKAMINVAPKQEVKARRIGGANYQVPIEVRGDRKQSLSIRWLIEAARARSSKEYHTFAEKLSAELLDAAQNLGSAVKKKESMQKMAESNRAFAHFRF